MQTRRREISTVAMDEVIFAVWLAFCEITLSLMKSVDLVCVDKDGNEDQGQVVSAEKFDCIYSTKQSPFGRHSKARTEEV